MAEFKVIETQEELDRIIGDRLEREKAKATKNEESFKAEIESLKKTISDSQATITDLTEKQNGHADEVANLTKQIASYKIREIKHQIAHQNGLPYELAERLTGDTEEELTKDAETLKGLMGASKPVETPKYTPETPPADDKTQDLKQVLEKLQRR